MNIGIELAAKPSLLFMDEPTSGNGISGGFCVSQGAVWVSTRPGERLAALGAAAAPSAPEHPNLQSLPCAHCLGLYAVMCLRGPAGCP